MLMRTDPFRDFDRLTEALMGTRARPAVMPMDAYREDGTFVVHLDLPGVTTESIDLTVEQNVLTMHAERKPPLATAPRRSSTNVPTACSADSCSSATPWTPTGSRPTTTPGC